MGKQPLSVYRTQNAISEKQKNFISDQVRDSTKFQKNFTFSTKTENMGFLSGKLRKGC